MANFCCRVFLQTCSPGINAPLGPESLVAPREEEVRRLNFSEPFEPPVLFL